VVVRVARSEGPVLAAAVGDALLERIKDAFAGLLVVPIQLAFAPATQSALIHTGAVPLAKRTHGPFR
jgi:hypothetical protein